MEGYKQGQRVITGYKAGQGKMRKGRVKWRCEMLLRWKACHSYFPEISFPTFRASSSLLIRSVRGVWVMLWPANSMSLLYLLQADLRLIFPSARWILAQLLSISICAKVKSLQDLGLNTGCLATAPFDPLNPTLFQPAWTASCGDVDEGEAGGDEGGVGASGPAR